MRKIYSLALALMAGATAFGQLTHTVNNGEFKITYGKSADWSIFDPQGAPTIYLHVWWINSKAWGLCKKLRQPKQEKCFIPHTS